jgi:hypothetical protein
MAPMTDLNFVFNEGAGESMGTAEGKIEGWLKSAKEGVLLGGKLDKAGMAYQHISWIVFL